MQIWETEFCKLAPETHRRFISGKASLDGLIDYMYLEALANLNFPVACYWVKMLSHLCTSVAVEISSGAWVLRAAKKCCIDLQPRTTNFPTIILLAGIYIRIIALDLSGKHLVKG